MYSTREVWLKVAAEKLYSGVFAEANVPTPEKYRVSCGWALGKRKPVGQAFPKAMSADGHNELFVSPKLDDPLQVLNILTHEMVHGSDDCQHGHKGLFKTYATSVGLEGKMTSTTSSSWLVEVFKRLVEEIGDYPHGSLSQGSIKKQTTRLVKCDCRACGFVARTTRKWTADMPVPAVCPVCSVKAFGDSEIAIAVPPPVLETTDLEALQTALDLAEKAFHDEVDRQSARVIERTRRYLSPRTETDEEIQAIIDQVRREVGLDSDSSDTSDAGSTVVIGSDGVLRDAGATA